MIILPENYLAYVDAKQYFTSIIQGSIELQNLIIAEDFILTVAADRAWTLWLVFFFVLFFLPLSVIFSFCLYQTWIVAKWNSTIINSLKKIKEKIPIADGWGHGC